MEHKFEREIYEKIAERLIKRTFIEMINWYSAFTSREKEEILVSEPEVIKLISNLEYYIRNHIPILAISSENECILYNIDQLDLVNGVLKIKTKGKIPTGGESVGMLLAYECITSYKDSLSLPIYQSIHRLFDKEIFKDTEIHITAILYIIHASILLFRGICEICYFIDGDKFDFADLSERVTILTRYFTIMNNIMNDSGLSLKGKSELGLEPEECRFLVDLTAMPNGDVLIEHIRIVLKNL